MHSYAGPDQNPSHTYLVPPKVVTAGHAVASEQPHEPERRRSAGEVQQHQDAAARLHANGDRIGARGQGDVHDAAETEARGRNMGLWTKPEAEPVKLEQAPPPATAIDRDLVRGWLIQIPLIGFLAIAGLVALFVTGTRRRAREAMAEAGWEIASHGLRWIDYQHIPVETERAHMQEAIRLHTEITGERPLGWYTGRCSPNTLRLVAEDGGFAYCADSYADDLPYWVTVEGRPQLIVPYTLEANDMRFAIQAGYTAGDQFERVTQHVLGDKPPRLDSEEGLPDRPPEPAGMTYGIPEDEIPF